jgi:L-methionine (R)-S-oxide reductase
MVVKYFLERSGIVTMTMGPGRTRRKGREMISATGTEEQVLSEIHSYADHEDDFTAVLATVSAVLKAHRPYYTWVGFYLFKEDMRVMILGPYQGPPTCTTRIPISAGICGVAARERRTVVLADVRSDPRYIACSPAVRSEIVVPLLDGDRIIGVMDLDSDTLSAFGPNDQSLLETVARYVVGKRRRAPAQCARDGQTAATLDGSGPSS